MLILKEAFNGTRRFGEFQRNLNVPRQTLTARLQELCLHQMLYRHFLNANAGVPIYLPTAKTFDLQDAMYSIWLWHRANPSDVDPLRFDLVHRDCGQILSARYCCRQCSQPADNSNTTVVRPQPLQFETAPRSRIGRRNDTAITASLERQDIPIAASLVGDVPCNEILYSLFQSPSHLAALSRELGMGKIVVRNRLDKLIGLGLVHEDQAGRRTMFTIKERATQFYPLLLSIAAWGNRWCNDGMPPPELYVHRCGELLRGQFQCDHCGGWAQRSNISVRPKM